MPRYNIKKMDTLAALAEEDPARRVGNCFVKAVIGCGLIVVRHAIEPSVAFSERLHATPKPSMLSASRAKNFAHIATVIAEADGAGADPSGEVLSLCFGIAGKSGEKVSDDDRGDILDYNEVDPLIEVNPIDGALSATEHTIDTPEGPVNSELYVGTWREGINRYLDALDYETLDPDAVLERIEAVFGAAPADTRLAV